MNFRFHYRLFFEIIYKKSTLVCIASQKRDLAKSTKIQKIFFAPTIKELEKDLPDLEFIETLFNP